MFSDHKVICRPKRSTDSRFGVLAVVVETKDILQGLLGKINQVHLSKMSMLNLVLLIALVMTKSLSHLTTRQIR